MSLTADQFVELLNGGRESRAVEFKAAGPRGDLLVFAFVAPAVLAMSTGEARVPGPRGTRGAMLIPDDEQTGKEFNAEIGLILGMMKPRFFSYRSGRLVFDSAVFQSYARGLDRAPAHLQEVKKKAEIAIAQNIANMRSPDLARAIAATLAVRTHRLRKR